MPTYEYETIPQGECEAPERFEVWQNLSEEPLTQHPETGQPVQRIISAGLLVRSKGSSCCESRCTCS